MSTHGAPGPWHWKPRDKADPNRLPVLLDANGNEVCDFGRDEQYYSTEGCAPADADAALIAAAPSLLAALTRRSRQGGCVDCIERGLCGACSEEAKLCARLGLRA